MKKDLIWAYLIHLSVNMWGDADGTNKYSPYCDRFVTDEPTWKEVIDYLPSQGINTVLIDVGDAILYESHPEVSIPGAWSKDKMKAELDYIRSLGMTPVPKLNFSACHDAWLGKYSRMLSTPEYYQVCKDLIQEVADVFDNPSLFHLGLDEETADHQMSLAYSCIRQGDLWWHDAYYLFGVCDKVGTRPWVWSDYLWHHPEEFLKKMPKSVLQSNWYYYGGIKKDSKGIYTKPQYEAYRTLDQAGYDQVLTSSAIAGCWYNSQETMQLGKEDLSPELLKGFMTAPWFNTFASFVHALKHDALQFGEGKRKVFP